MTTARAFWVERPGHGSIRAEDLADPGPDDVLVKTSFSGISRGTEILVFQGRVPESQHALMRCPFQAGDFPGPVKYGYIAVGTVEAGAGDLLGREVFSLHPHQDRFLVPAAMAVPLPDALPATRAVLAANMETALNVIWDAEIADGQRVAVIGLGVVGLLIAHQLAKRGLDVTAIDIDPGKAALATALGLRFATSPDGVYQRLIHASGHPDGLVTALGHADFEARIVEASWYGSRPVTLPLGEAFHSKRLTLASSQVGHVAPAMRDSLTLRGRMERALTELCDPVYDALIDGESDFENLPRTMAALADGRLRATCHRVRYPD